MKKDIAELWIKALTSGDYGQAHGSLRVDFNGGTVSTFCCLGVLCNLHAEAHPEIAAEQTTRGRYMDQENFLPVAVQKWAGMSSATGAVGKTNLANENDQGASFKDIAKLIRKHREAL